MNTSGGAWLNYFSKDITKTHPTNGEKYRFEVMTTISTDRKGTSGSAQVWVYCWRGQEEITLFTYDIARMNFYSLFFFIEQHQELCWNWLVTGDLQTVISQVDRVFAEKRGPVIKVSGKLAKVIGGTDIEVVM